MKIMFLCTANSCRSQMAEGLARELGQGRAEAYSAGLMKTSVNERAMAVMKEIGIDISGQRSKEIDPDLLLEMDLVVTVCGNAEQACPATPPHIRRLHWPIEDPVKARGTEEEVMKEFRRAREELRSRIEKLLKDENIIKS